MVLILRPQESAGIPADKVHYGFVILGWLVVLAVALDDAAVSQGEFDRLDGYVRSGLLPEHGTVLLLPPSLLRKPFLLPLTSDLLLLTVSLLHIAVVLCVEIIGKDVLRTLDVLSEMLQQLQVVEPDGRSILKPCFRDIMICGQYLSSTVGLFA